MGFLTAEKMEAVQANRSTGRYFQPSKHVDEKGDGVKIRFLGNAITGVGGWRDGKPVRFPIRPDSEEFDIATLDVDMSGKPGVLRDFIASVIWNYEEECIQIFEFNQVTIQDQLIALHRDADNWGDPTGYDVIIKKTKKGDRTEYQVVPSPKNMGKLSKEVEQAFDETFVDLQKLFTNEDPFKAGE